MTELNAAQIEAEFTQIQSHIRERLSHYQTPRADSWRYDKGNGGGLSLIWEGNSAVAVLEKGGVNFSGISGQDLPTAAVTQFAIAPNTTFNATGVSIVIHPSNPNVPTIHMNIRYFEAGEKWWFGGGIDLTPYYPVQAQVIAFHRALKVICEECGQNYTEYKRQCDEYFTLAHRGEMRGVGGIFFDHLNAPDKLTCFQFVRRLGMEFMNLYEPFLIANRTLAFSAKQREFQLIRRGRYVEFNLLYDRGTKFGLQSGGRTESILMSLPAEAVWKYDWHPEANSVEEHVTNFYLQPQDWVNMSD